MRRVRALCGGSSFCNVPIILLSSFIIAALAQRAEDLSSSYSNCEALVGPGGALLGANIWWNVDDSDDRGQRRNRRSQDATGLSHNHRPIDYRSLPEQIVRNPTTALPAESRDCLICLETFREGDKRKILPCFHGFHTACIDKWHNSNPSCPICKHSI